MSKNKKEKRILIVLLAILCLGLIVGLTLGRYVGEWDQLFGLLISPSDSSEPLVPCYFRSNELLPATENASYTVNGMSTWFTVANGLDSSTVSQLDVKYTLTWYISEDGSAWTEYKTVSATMPANAYTVSTKYTVEPVTVGSTVHNYVKVIGSTSSFLQENIEAVYVFQYESATVSKTYADGVVTVRINTNDEPGSYTFAWADGITPDNSDPNGIFTTAAAGPSDKSVTLNSHTVYEFLFFVTGEVGIDPTQAVTVSKRI